VDRLGSMTTTTTDFCWWELVIAVAGLVVSVVMLPTTITEGHKGSAWFVAVSFAIFSIAAVICFRKLWNV
jgi:hypothetical protein